MSNPDTTDRVLPEKFAELEPFAAKWVIPTEAARYTERLNSTMDEMQAFYDAAYPRIGDVMAYLDGFPLSDLPEREGNLLQLLYSVIMVSLPVEVWQQPRVIDAGTAYFDRYQEPVP